MTQNTHIITVSGPSLSGKTEFTRILKEIGDFNVITSVTTRPPRRGEVDGVDYDFITEQKFKSLKMVQTTHFNGFYYGVSEEEVEKKSDKPILWVIAPQSIGQVEIFSKEKNWMFSKVFISNPQEVLLERFLERFKNDELADIKNYSKRLNNIVQNEMSWITDAVNNVINYDFKALSFNKENTEDVIKSFYEFMHSKNTNQKNTKPKIR